MSDPSDSSPRRPRKLRFRILGWLAVASMLGLALLGPVAGAALALTAHVYTSTADGSVVDANIYEKKTDVYLTGGPCPQGGDLPDGNYYYEVVQPKGGGDLLSTDAISERQFTITDGFITATTGHLTHALICDSSAITVQLMPYDTSANGEYKLQVATVASVQDCAGFNADIAFPICQQADQKSDNFKVRSPDAVQPTIVTRATGPVVLGSAISDTAVLSNGSSPTGTITFNAYGPNDANCSGAVAFTATKTVNGNGEYTSGNFTPTAAGTYRWIASYSGDVNNLPVAGACNDANEASVVTPPEATVPAPTPTPTGGVEETATPSPGVTPPNTATDISPTGSGTDGWRIPLLGIGLLFGVLLLLTPSRTVRRRR